MPTCIICRFETEIDDVVVAGAGPGCQCVCLRCFARETGNTRPMRKALVRELSATLSAMEAA